jgi:hypothetical protein
MTSHMSPAQPLAALAAPRAAMAPLIAREGWQAIRGRTCCALART